MAQRKAVSGFRIKAGKLVKQETVYQWFKERGWDFEFDLSLDDAFPSRMSNYQVKFIWRHDRDCAPD